MTRRLSLRARLAVLTSVAVAVAVAACAVGCWFVVSGRLMEQLDQSLSGQRGPLRGSPQAICDQPPHDDARSAGFLPTMQVVRADGTVCSPPDTASPLVVTVGDVAIARGERGPTYRDGRTEDGTPMRVFTRSGWPGTGLGAAVSVARPLTTVDESLNSLAMLLVAVSAVGVFGAAVAGLVIARAGLRPVDRLTEVVEHIARTEDLDTAIPEGGKDEIARLSRSFNSMTRALARARDRQQQLIVDAGHELRTPLTSLRTNVDLMLRSESTGRPLPAADKHTLLVNVKEQLVELSSLVGDLLDLSRAEAASDGVVALHEVVENAVRRARLRGLTLRIDATVSPWYVHGDAASLERAVVNLLDNAVKFSPPEGAVTVRLDGGELTVRDHGPGVPSEDLPYVFDRFWRSPSARSLPGSGLGLAIVARVIREAGGQVGLGPAEGGGTLAWLRLPGSATPAEDDLVDGDVAWVGIADTGSRVGGVDGGREA
ncbi:two-component sensor histidine kinase [Planotetraspora silvatica]|uniref:histidine kinase n=1 Tax=Planotetraspora silvatica TaxID=234614 RepID=A0A8J3UR42_9ACTN|nr:HAMP domain-containing sensor histidine kinase [Planotetraspora silvatica]GII49793.1 two-component sensor histidine kinase [Planotetraspora silvatica]